ncbi:MAG: 3-methyl-2-oxobutanoate hydroxymethyltransferase [Thermoanaerobaculia bacterium]
MSESGKSVSVRDIAEKKGHERIVMLTAYDAPSAKLLDEAGVDVLLVGDSVEMAVYGESSTLTAQMDSMIRHARAVARASRRALVVGDMPFLSYQASAADAVRNAGRFLAEAGAAAVKVEGGRRVLPSVEAILAADIPVMGHVGMTPQSFRKFGGFKVQGRSRDSADEILEDAVALEKAGCFSVVLECVPDALAQRITAQLSIPTIGIGAGPHCDGQVLVFHDLLGLSGEFRPKFVRRYADLGEIIRDAARRFSEDVRSGEFPSAGETFLSDAPALRRVH